MTNNYDSVGRLLGTVLQNSAALTLNAHSYAYDLAGERTRQTFKGGNYTDYAYDLLGQLTSAKGKESGGAINRLQEQLSFVFDAAGNLNLRTNNALVQSFNVNNLNELTTATRSGTFTVAGNTTTPATNVTVNGSAASRYADNTFAKDGFTLADGNNTFTVTAENPYGFHITNSLTVNLPATTTFVYDLNGNLRTNGTRIYDYDAENQLVTNSVAGEWKAEFAYDGLGRRKITRDYTWQTGAWIKTNETRLLYDGLLPIQERDANNAVKVTYTRGRDLSGTRQGAGGIGGLLARTDSSGSAFYHADGSGNITALMNANQLIVGKYLYDPFGNLLAMSGPLAPANIMRFSSKPVDLTGDYDFGFRRYSTILQQFLTEDPLGEAGGIPLHGFVGNNPVNQVDPLGLEGNPVMGLGGAWNSDPYGAGGSFYGPGYLYTPHTPPPSMPFDLGRSIYTGPLTPFSQKEWNDTAWYNQNRPNSIAAAKDYFKKQIEKKDPCPPNTTPDFIVRAMKGRELGHSEWELGDPQQSLWESVFWIGDFAFRLSDVNYRLDGSYTAQMLLIDKLGVEQQYGGSFNPYFRMFVGPSREYISGRWQISGSAQK